MKRPCRWLLMLVPAVVVVVGVAPIADARDTADLRVTQTAAPKSNDVLVLQDTVTNAGPSAATATVIETVSGSGITGMTVSNSTVGVRCKAFAPPAGTAFARRCTTLNPLPSGGIWRLTFRVTGPTGTAVKGTGDVSSSDTSDPEPADNTTSVSSWTGPVADLALSAVSVPGNAEAILLSVTNAGPNTAPRVVVSTDDRNVYLDGTGCGKASQTCDIGPLPAGATWHGTAYHENVRTPFSVRATHPPDSFDPTSGDTYVLISPANPRDQRVTPR